MEPAPPDTQTDAESSSDEPRLSSSASSGSESRSPAESADRDGIGLISIAVRGVVTLALLVAGSVAAWALVATAPAIDLAPVEALATPVVVFEPTAQPVARRWDGFGTAEAFAAADVPARVTSTVAALGGGVREGAPVQAGQTLVLLESEDFTDEVTRLVSLVADTNARLGELDVLEASLAERAELLETDLALQQTEARRVSGLRDRNVATAQDVDRALSQVLAARNALSSMQQQREAVPAQREALTAGRAALEAQLAVARRNLGRAEIRSPIAGQIEQLDVDPGEGVQPGQRVARVVDPSIIEVPLRLPAGSRGSVSVGDAVTLRSSRAMHDSLPSPEGAGEKEAGRTWSATVVRINPTDDARTRTLTVYAVLDQELVPPAERLAPGLFVAGTVTAGQPTPRLVVPRRSLRRGRLQLAVPATDGRSSALRTTWLVSSFPVEVAFNLRAQLGGTGLPDDQWAVLSTELPEGARVVLTANASLLDGQAIEPREVGE